MRNVIASELVSLDGVMESPEEWASTYSNDEMEAANAAGMATSDVLLLERVTSEQLAAYWPHQSDENLGLHQQRAQVRRFDDSRRGRVAQLVPHSGDVTEKVTDLTRQLGENITILGSGVLVRSLLHNGPLDELQLMVHPVILGNGKCLFEDGSDRNALELVGSGTFDTGVVSLIYQPAATEVEEGR